MLSKIIDALEAFTRRRAKKVLQGIPVLWITYDSEGSVPNVNVHVHPELQEDEYLKGRYEEIAYHLRKYYCDWRG